ncbi:MAG: DUF2442 domain-containing protein [Alphaproteobacteria bacterium]|nr:DUF2442 domain-containing protein [Alphaproteobacteria bacterium]
MRRIISVQADPERQTLTLRWADRGVTIKDMRSLIAKRRVFAPLGDPRVFAKARVVDGGHGIAWGDDIDYAADALWNESHPKDWPYPDVLMSAAEFRAWMAEGGLSLARAAEALGISRRQAAYYASGEKTISRLVFLACMALVSRPVERKRAA